MAKAKGDKETEVVESPKIEETPEAPTTVPENLSGSGTKQLTVKANASVLGLQAFEIRTIPDSEEVRANIRTGNLELIRESDGSNGFSNGF